MESRLMNIIGTPSMVLVVVTGSSLLHIQAQYLQEPWMWAKLFFIVCLITYHFFCLRVQKKLQHHIAVFSSTALRMINELATIFLVAIVFLIELRSLLDMVYGILGLLLLAALMMIAIKWYKSKREA